MAELGSEPRSPSPHPRLFPNVLWSCSKGPVTQDSVWWEGLGRGWSAAQFPHWGLLWPICQRPQGQDGSSLEIFLFQQLQGNEGCPHTGALLELFWELGEARAGVSNITFPKIAGWGWWRWALRLDLGNSCALWLAKHCTVKMSNKLHVRESHMCVSCPAAARP